jgi:hypothetical protein
MTARQKYDVHGRRFDGAFRPSAPRAGHPKGLQQAKIKQEEKLRGVTSNNKIN